MILASCPNFSSHPGTLPRELGLASDLAREWRDQILCDASGHVPPLLLEAAETATWLPAHAIGIEVGNRIVFVNASRDLHKSLEQGRDAQSPGYGASTGPKPVLAWGLARAAAGKS